jgi:hypothetical protein
MVNERSRRLARSTSYRGSVFTRLSHAEKKSKPQTIDKREKSAVSWRDSSNSETYLAELTDSSFKRAPCSAVYPARRSFSTWSTKTDFKKACDHWQNDDIGIKLYRTGLERQHRREQQSLGRSVEQELATPSWRSASLSSRSYRDDSSFVDLRVTPEDGLLQRYTQQLRRLSEAQKAENSRIQGQCPFRPQLNPNTRLFAQQARAKKKGAKSVGDVSRSRSRAEEGGNDEEDEDSVFNQLNQAKKRQVGQYVPAGCTFQPKISKCFSKGKQEYLAQPICQRMASAQQASQTRLEQVRKKRETAEKFDVATGQRLHHPRISRGPKKNDRDSAKPLHEHLHKDSYLEIKRLKAVRMAQQRLANIQAKTYSLENSKKLLEGSRQKKGAELFKLLDPDDCGSISKGHIRLDCNFHTIPQTYPPRLWTSLRPCYSPWISREPR